MFPSEILQKVVANIKDTQETEYFCNEVHSLMDQYVEACIECEDLSLLMPLVQHHLKLCLDCQEEFEALLRILQARQKT